MRNADERGNTMARRVRKVPLSIFFVLLAVALVLPLALQVFPRIFRLGNGHSADEAADSTIRDRDDDTVRISLVMVGDILLHDNVNSCYLQEDGSYDYTPLFAQVKDEISAADVAIVNQETPLAGAEYGYVTQLLPMDASDNPSYMPVFNSPRAVADAEVAAGFDVVLKAENHVFDQGYSGLASELAFWKENYPEVAVLGVADPTGESGQPDYANSVYVYEKDGFRVAILNFCHGINLVGGGYDEEVLSFISDEKIISDVEKARAAKADMIVACPHWGSEYVTEEGSEQAHYAQVMADAGVDVIFGTHPHILEPVKVIEGKDGHRCVCFYSNGNFITGTYGNDTMITGLSEAVLAKAPNGECTIESATLLPAVVHGGYGPDMTTYLLRDYTDELAASSYNPNLTPEYATQFCAEVLGSEFDTETKVMQVRL